MLNTYYCNRMNILKTSKLIQNSHDDEEDYDPNSLDYDFEFSMLYNVFASTKVLKIDFDIAKKAHNRPLRKAR